jgi:hypothetical protein
MVFHRLAYAFLGLYFLLASPFRALAVEQIPLDPSAPPQPLPAIVTAVVVEPLTSRYCTVRLSPNGVVSVARPCGLEAKLKAVKAWRQRGTTIEFLTARHNVVLAFLQTGERSYATKPVDGVARLTLKMLPQASMPLQGPAPQAP